MGGAPISNVKKRTVVTVELFIGAWISLLLIGTGAFYWIMSEFRALRAENRATREELRQEIRATREELHQEIRATREELHQEIRATREELRQEIQGEAQERRTDVQRILEALYFHRHDPDGTAIFYPPSQTPQAD